MGGQSPPKWGQFRLSLPSAPRARGSPTSPARWDTRRVEPSSLSATSAYPACWTTSPCPSVDGTYRKLLARLAKTELLLIDDFGLAPLSDVERRDLLEILEDRYSQRATAVGSQLPIEHWHEVIGDPTIADAILDRLVHGAHRSS